MPYRRRRRRRRKTRNYKQLAWRTGKYNAAGGKKISPNSKTIRSITCNHFSTLAATDRQGCTMSFNIVDWSKPATPDTSTFTTNGTVTKPVPHNHAEVLLHGYTIGRVLSAMYRFNIRYTATSSGAKDWVFAYKFGSSATAAETWVTKDESIDAWKSMRQSFGWTYKRMSSTHEGGSIYPSSAIIKIDIPNVRQLTKKLIPNVEHEQQVYEHTLTAGSNSAEIDCFLHIAVFHMDGEDMASDSIRMDLDTYQTVRVRKNFGTANMIGEVVDET